MNIKRFKKEVEKVCKSLKEHFTGKVRISVDGYVFDVDSVSDFEDGVIVNSRSMMPVYRYRFTFLMFDPKSNDFRGITHRTYRCHSDEEIVKDRDKCTPKWEDTKYVISRIERELDEESRVYKDVWENDKL